jgi:hypothetical protein
MLLGLGSSGPHRQRKVSRTLDIERRSTALDVKTAVDIRHALRALVHVQVHQPRSHRGARSKRSGGLQFAPAMPPTHCR